MILTVVLSFCSAGLGAIIATIVCVAFLSGPEEQDDDA